MKRPFINFRLALMFYIQYSVMGAIFPILSTYLHDSLGFSGKQAGTIMAMFSISAFLYPLLGAYVADRLVCKERLLAMCHLLAGCMMFVLYFQTEFAPFLVCYFFYNIAYGPSLGLTNAIAFHHMEKDQASFGHIRLWGTVAWVVVAFAFGYLWLGGVAEGEESRLGHALLLSASCSILLGLYSLTLPKSEVTREKVRRIIPEDALKIMMQRDVLFVCLILFLAAYSAFLYYFGLSPHLRAQGISEKHIMPLMSAGQMTEIAAMFLLAFAIRRLGLFKVLLIGICSNIWRFIAFAIDDSRLIVFSGILCHGFTYAFVSLAIMIYIDSQCDRKVRAGVHQLLSIVNMGCGAILGTVSGGFIMDLVSDEAGTVNYMLYWMIPASIAILCLVVAIFFIPAELRAKIRSSSSDAPNPL